MSVLDAVARPGSWRITQLGRLFRRVQETGFAELQSLSVFLGDGVVPRSEREDNYNQLGADLSKYQRVQPRDIVFNKLRTWQGGFGVSRYTGIVSPAYIVCRPLSDDIHPGYAHHLLRSEPYLAESTRLSKWMPPSQFDIAWDDIRTLSVALPPAVEQQRIADFLDQEVARIDNIIAARRQQLDHLAEYLQAAIDTALDPGPHGGAPAARFLRVLPGWAFPSDGYTVDPGDIRLLRGVNVGTGRVRWDDVVYWPADGIAGLTAFDLADGDVVMGMDRPWIGGGLRIARIGPADLPCLLLQRVAKLIPSPALRPEFVFWAYRATAFRQEVESELTGLAVPHLSAEQILSHRLPVAGLAEQDRIVGALSEISSEQQSLAAAIQLSTGQAEELKRSLITAAVTGEFDVSSADGSRIPA